MMFFKKYVVVCILFVSPFIYAKQYEYTGSCRFTGYDDVFEACLDQELAMHDKELNHLYHRFQKMSSYDKLKKIELLWIKFKEEDCKYMAREVNGGKEYQSVYKACLINKTKARIRDFKRSYFDSDWFIRTM